MEKIIIKGGNKLSGEVDISTAKNSVLPIIAATILSPNNIIIKKLPLFEDVRVFINLLREINCSINITKDENLEINTDNINISQVNGELIRKMRASFLLMGPMLARFGYCKISLPGGCNIGSRPIDLHLKGFEILGAKITSQNGYVEARADKLIGNRIYLDFPSVGATENIIMASVLAEGTTIIENSAREPEVIDLINFLNKIGANIMIESAGKIIIEGVTELKGCEYLPIYDRIEAGTFMIAAAITNSKLIINGINEAHLSPLMGKLKESGVIIDCNKNKLIIDGRVYRKPVNVKTLPYPGFPTDMQAQMMSLLAVTKGSSIITETVFENRFMHVPELVRMGANINIDGRTAFIEGVDRLTGCSVRATDLRAGAAMILAGLIAEGKTEVTDIYHIDRGYVDIEKKLKKLGADICRIDS